MLFSGTAGPLHIFFAEMPIQICALFSSGCLSYHGGVRYLAGTFFEVPKLLTWGSLLAQLNNEH